MRLHDYQKLALRTAPEFKERLLSAKKDALVHCVLGLTGEVSEILEDQGNFTNVVQEVGDNLWYISLGLFAINIDLEDIKYADSLALIEDAHQDLSIQVGIIADCIKRNIYYDTELNTSKFLKAIEAIIACLFIILDEDEDVFEDALEKNIEKLKMRYPGKYSHEQAINRNVRKESKIFDA